MLRPESATSPLSSNVEATRPTAAIGQQGGFSSLYSEVAAEVGQFIRQGSQAGGQGSATAAQALTPEAGLLRARVQGSLTAADNGVDDADRRAFIDRIRPLANEAASRLGVAPELVMAHAALESGWGRSPVRSSDGRSTFNLFGIKAGANWQGERVTAMTTEHVDGEDVGMQDTFRSYPDARSAFGDYARLLSENPRYASALNAGGDAHAFAQGLARGGYATDPAYADKLARVAQQLMTMARR
ncbi:flagellar assembly peptidoglycan hydrolase FlgJ [Methyloversatilis thermotolerans]|uniref:flagellar assembly peptidoglycan hydrolase FlgJ n=1 Tax=Methyloversatilis thermotolerans TaxID=1346290 RepID=UPI000374967F|nr:flagellar assembly peptidoglycan hydrolase FlgJ [Methyloversatilis thermotolerans]